ncbi:hypothetical protein ACLEPN_32700 [Myxococcus sp. 1LA]
MTRQCSTVTVADDGATVPCLESAIEDADFCQRCAETAVQEGDVFSLRCPWCGTFGDFTHLAAEDATSLVERVGDLGRKVECGSCGCESHVLEACLHLRIQRVLTPDEEDAAT